MGASTKIEWCDYTWNPWRGCTKVDAGCHNCYAEKQSKRNPTVLGIWGDQGQRVLAASDYWREPKRWNTHAEVTGTRPRVFCASLADVFEDWAGGMTNVRGEPLAMNMRDARRMLFDVIDATPHLDWLLLTKRPENVGRMWPGLAYRHRNNVWLGTSISDQETADRKIPQLLKSHDRAAKLFVSAEPLLDGLNLEKWLPDIDWVIVGGESGPGARPCHLVWIRDIVDQCRQVGTACFVKQLGANVHANDVIDAADHFPGVVTLSQGDLGHCHARAHLKHKKGGDPAEWPEDLRVRQLPGRDSGEGSPNSLVRSVPTT